VLLNAESTCCCLPLGAGCPIVCRHSSLLLLISQPHLSASRCTKFPTSGGRCSSWLMCSDRRTMRVRWPMLGGRTRSWFAFCRGATGARGSCAGGRKGTYYCNMHWRSKVQPSMEVCGLTFPAGQHHPRQGLTGAHSALLIFIKQFLTSWLPAFSWRQVN
jgi:hypothetical protein